MNTDYVPDFDPATNIARQALYRFAALSLLDPQAGSWEKLAALAEDPLLVESAALICSMPEARPSKLLRGERSLSDLHPEKVLALLPNSRSAFNRDYERTFGLLVSAACPPYESEYIHSKLEFQRSNSIADVSGFYHAFGLTVSQTHPERQDHVVLELEFMAFLLEMERRANESESEHRANRRAICRDAQVRFLKEHLAWWVPTFAKLLADEGRGGFYEQAAVFLAALIPAERALLHVEIDSRPLAPSSLEDPDACEGCQLAMNNSS